MNHGINPEFITDDANKTIGISFGADFITEHECGIKEIRSDFGIDTALMGVERIICHKFPKPYIKDVSIEVLEYHNSKKGNLIEKKVQKKGLLLLHLTNYEIIDFYLKNSKDDNDFVRCFDLHPYHDKTLYAAWDEKTFGVLALDDDAIRLQEIVKLWDDNDMAITLGGFKAFSNGGLVIIRASEIPEEIRTKMLNTDIDYKNLLKAAEDTGIKKKLEKADKRYFALSPRWAKDFERLDTKYPVIFWLNPHHQQIYNAGWFTVENLLDWINDSGPIMMN